MSSSSTCIPSSGRATTTRPIRLRTQGLCTSPITPRSTDGWTQGLQPTSRRSGSTSRPVPSVSALLPARITRMAEWRLFDEGTTPEHTTAAWYAGRDAAPHLEQEGHRQRILLVADMIKRNVPHDTPIIDLGSGDGGLLALLDDYP